MSLVAEGVSVRFGGVRAVDRVSLILAPGEALGLIGPNGAGKTTLVNVLSGFQRPSGGRVAIDGTAYDGWPPQAFSRAGVVRTFQGVRLFGRLSVAENVEAGHVSAGAGRGAARRAAAAVLERLGLAAKAGWPAASLSYGEQRRLGIARALALKPRYLLLDEPAAGLNPAEAVELGGLIGEIRAAEGCGVLLIEHNVALVRAVCTRLQVLDSGAVLAEGLPAAVLASAAVRDAYLGSEADG